MIYLDNAATSFFKPNEVKKTIFQAINRLTANPGRSGHKLSNMTAEVIYDTRELLKDFFHAEDYDVVFTKNCSEALNLAILGYLKKGDHVICTRYEHNSILRPLKHIERDIEWTVIDGEMSELPGLIESHIKDNTKLVITTHISNVTGELCDVNAIGRICNSHGVRYLVDGAQSCGHIAIDLSRANIDMFAFAGHKGLLAVGGVGGLIVKKGVKLHPILFGGTGTDSENLIQPTTIPEGLEAGTIPTIPIISLKAGVEFLYKNFEQIIKKEQNLSKYAYFSLKKLDFLEIYSKESSLNVFSFNLKNIDPNHVANELNSRYSICVRSGLHCAPLIHDKIDAMNGAVRVSIDFNNTEREINVLCDALSRIYYKHVLT